MPYALILEDSNPPRTANGSSFLAQQGGLGSLTVLKQQSSSRVSLSAMHTYISTAFTAVGESAVGLQVRLAYAGRELDPTMDFQVC